MPDGTEPAGSKRKRTLSSLPCIDTLPGPPMPALERIDSDSPRTTVAHHLGRLQMSDEQPIKQRVAHDHGNHGVSSRSTSPSPSLTHRARSILNPPRRVTSPPPPTPVASPGVEPDMPMPTSTAIMIAQDKLSALRCDSPSTPDSPPPPPSSTDPSAPRHNQDKSLTWQESEITGHHIDTAAEDDGEGINGIGFIPTPAIATKRAEWRRRQIHDWRSRESKEARQQRYDKRKAPHRDSAVAFDERGALKRRMVRFAEV